MARLAGLALAVPRTCRLIGIIIPIGVWSDVVSPRPKKTTAPGPAVATPVVLWDNRPEDPCPFAPGGPGTGPVTSTRIALRGAVFTVTAIGEETTEGAMTEVGLNKLMLMGTTPGEPGSAIIAWSCAAAVGPGMGLASEGGLR